MGVVGAKRLHPIEFGWREICEALKLTVSIRPPAVFLSVSISKRVAGFTWVLNGFKIPVTLN